MNAKLQAKIKQLPLSPGVYIYKNQQGKIIYVGKAVKLKKRVAQYFQKQQLDPKTQALVAEIADLKYMVTASELDALLLEAELIKRYQPPYNILLRDDKSAVYVQITTYKSLPDIQVVRLPSDERALYFGPFYNAYPIRQALRFLRRIFPYFMLGATAGFKSELYRQIGLEPAVETEAERQSYRRDIQKIVRFLRGDSVKLIREIEQAMKESARVQDFEQATILRNQLFQLKALQQRTYLNSSDEKVFQHDPSLSLIKSMFGLKNLPTRIEAFDISHLGGTNVVASMTVFVNALPSRADYRRFKIKIDQNNDYASMREVLTRRFQAKNIEKWGLPALLLIDGGKGQLGVACDVLAELGFDKILVFGLAERLEEIVISPRSNIKLDKTLKPVVSGEFLILALPFDDPALRLFQRLRDEAHRFAVAYQAKLAQKHNLTSWLDNIKGIGPQTRRKIQKKYGNFEQFLQADLAELTDLLGEKRAKLIEIARLKGDKKAKTSYNNTDKLKEEEL